jgi:hypothetical protein
MNLCDKINNFLKNHENYDMNIFTLPEKNAVLNLLIDLSLQSMALDEQYIKEVNILVKSGASFFSDYGYEQVGDFYDILDLSWYGSFVIPKINSSIKVVKKDKYHMVKKMIERDVSNIKTMFLYDRSAYSRENLDEIKKEYNKFSGIYQEIRLKLIKKYVDTIDILDQQLISDITFLIMNYCIEDDNEDEDEDKNESKRRK